MKGLSFFFLVVCVNICCRAGVLIEESWFPRVDGADVKAEYIDLNTNNTEKLYIRYSPLTDSGVELERVTNNVVVWRTHVEPIIPLSQQLHSKYCHEVGVRINDDKIHIISAAGLSVAEDSGVIYANSKDAQEVFEIHSLKTGELISRKVHDMQVQH